MLKFGIVVHGGVSSPVEYNDGCHKACEAGFKILESGGSALDAVTEAARILEDDTRFNAGSGSSLRLDGRTIEMDASLMDSDSNIGVVIGIYRVKNPILVAREVMKSPHLILCGKGAVEFARRKGFEDYYKPCEKAIERFNRIKRSIPKDYLENWNFETPYERLKVDTIGAVALDSRGKFAVANSTGGASPMLLGRVGDSPIIGAGFYAGSSGAIAATGVGEVIIKKGLSYRLYELLLHGLDAQIVCQSGLRFFPAEIPTGIIAISRDSYGLASNREMASWAMSKMK